MKRSASATQPQPDLKVEAFPHQRDSDGAILLDSNRVRVFSQNPRKKFRRIPELAESIKACGQQQPGKVMLIVGDPLWDAELIDGERRLRACKLAEVMFRAYPDTGVAGLEDQFERSFIANFGKEDHDCVEIAHSIHRMMTKSNRSLKEIAMMAGKSITWASQHLSLLKLHESVQEMLVPGENDEEDSGRRLTFSLALLLVQFPHELQIETAQGIVKGSMSMVKARRHIIQAGRDAGRPIQVNPKKRNSQFSSLMKLSEGLRDQIGLYLDMSDAEMTRMLQDAPPESKVLLLERLVAFDQEVTQLIEVLEKKARKVLRI